MRYFQFAPPTVVALCALVPFALADSAQPVGVHGEIGCSDMPIKADRLLIDKPGVYENYLIDGKWGPGSRVKITADNVIVRNCEIANCGGNGIGVFGTNVVIENCRIHHCLIGSFSDQKDAHGITGRWGNVVIRNCEIYYVSGDAVQFDPDRKSAGEVLIEDCTFWTAPLPADVASFKKGERPGENAVDTKTTPNSDRCRLVIRNCYLHGWNQPAQITNAAALNLKENVHVLVENCVLSNNEIGFRLRGPTSRGGAHVDIKRCAIYQTRVGARLEDKIENLRIDTLLFGEGVDRKYHIVGGVLGPGYENNDEGQAPPLQSLLKEGFGAYVR